MSQTNNKEPNLFKSTLVFTIGLVLVRGIGVLSAPIFTRILNPEEFGFATLFTSWYTIISILFSLYPQGALASAGLDYKGKKYDRYVSNAIGLSIVSYIGLSIVTIVLAYVFRSYITTSLLFLCMVLFAGFFQFLFNFYHTYLTYNSKFKTSLVLSFILSFFTVIISIIIIYLMPQNKGYGRIFGSIIPLTLIGIFVLKKLFHTKWFFNLENWKYSLTLSIPMIFNTLSTMLLGQTGKLMLGYYRNAEMVGVFSINYTIGEVPNYLRQAVVQTWIPWYFAKAEQQESQQVKNTSNILTTVFTLLCAIFILMVPEATHLLIHKDYWSGIPAIAPIVLGVFFNYLANFFTTELIRVKRNVIVTAGTLVALIVNVILNIFFIPIFGLMAVAVVSAISFFCMLLFYLIYFKISSMKVFFQYISFKNIMLNFLILFCSILIFYFLFNFPVHRWISGFVLLVCLLYYILKKWNEIALFSRKGE